MLGSRTLVLTAVAAALIVAGCGSTRGPEPTTPPEFLTFTDELGLFSLSYPPEWRLWYNRPFGSGGLARVQPERLEDPTKVAAFLNNEDRVVNGTIVFFLALPRNAPTVTVRLQHSRTPTRSGLAREQRALGEELTETALSRWEVLDTQSVTVGDQEALMVDVEINRLSTGPRHQRWRRLFIPSETIEDAQWEIDCTTTEEQGPFEASLALCDQVLRSFRVLG